LENGTMNENIINDVEDDILKLRNRRRGRRSGGRNFGRPSKERDDRVLFGFGYLPLLSACLNPRKSRDEAGSKWSPVVANVEAP
jgi:hypothetical protein